MSPETDPTPDSGQPGRSSTAPAQNHSTTHLPGTADRLIAFASSRGHYYAIILTLFAAVFLISNISATKVIAFGPIVTDGGAILFPLAYILGDVISEVYGFRAARKAILVGFAVQLLAVAVFFLVMIAPPGPGYEHQAAFEAVLGFYPRIVAASLAGFLVGQLVNAWIMVRIKARMGEKKLWVRIVTSTGVGEFLDTLIFCTVAFAGIIPGADFWVYVFVGFAYKCAVEFLFIPVTYAVTGWLKRHEPSYGAAGR